MEWVGQDHVGVKDHGLEGGDFADVLLQGDGWAICMDLLECKYRVVTKILRFRTVAWVGQDCVCVEGHRLERRDLRDDLLQGGERAIYTDLPERKGMLEHCMNP